MGRPRYRDSFEIRTIDRGIRLRPAVALGRLERSLVGLTPCSSAIIVLVFALAQGLFWIGVASTFVMGLGTAITVATIATIAVAHLDLPAISPRQSLAAAWSWFAS
jgi:hypothetical protein